MTAVPKYTFRAMMSQNRYVVTSERYEPHKLVKINERLFKFFMRDFNGARIQTLFFRLIEL
jgi:hypothetical protein